MTSTYEEITEQDFLFSFFDFFFYTIHKIIHYNRTFIKKILQPVPYERNFLE